MIRENCVSYGAYCAFFPKVGDIEQTMLDPEDYEMDNTPEDKLNLTNADQFTDFTGKELIIASLYEKCYHETLKKAIMAGKADDINKEEVYIE